MNQELILLSALTGLCALDATSAFQVMLSRPLVVGTLVGTVLGEPGAGFSLGCLLEMLWMGNLPVGSVVPPDTCVSTAVAVGAAALAKRMHPAASWEAMQGAALLASLPVAWLGGLNDIWQRRRQATLAEWVERRLEKGDESALGLAVAASLGLTFLRSFLLALGCLAALAPGLAWLLAHLPLAGRAALEWTYWLGLLLGFMVALDQFWERRFLNLAALSFFASTLAIYGLGVAPSTALAGAFAIAGLLGLKHEADSRRALKGQP